MMNTTNKPLHINHVSFSRLYPENNHSLIQTDLFIALPQKLEQSLGDYWSLFQSVRESNQQAVIPVEIIPTDPSIPDEYTNHEAHIIVINKPLIKRLVKEMTHTVIQMETDPVFPELIDELKHVRDNVNIFLQNVDILNAHTTYPPTILVNGGLYHEYRQVIREIITINDKLTTLGGVLGPKPWESIVKRYNTLYPLNSPDLKTT